MFQAVSHVGVGLKVKDPVATCERIFQQRLIERIPFDKPRARPPEQIGHELAPAGPKVVDNHNLDAASAQAVGEGAADEPGPPGDADTPHCYSLKPAETASRRNIWTVSSEN